MDPRRVRRVNAATWKASGKLHSWRSSRRMFVLIGEDMFRSNDLFAKLAVGLAAIVWMTSCAHFPTGFSQQSKNLPFVTHAAFFSEESRQSVALDPQVFVQEANAPAATGPQNIGHVAGYRNALISDAPVLKLFSASGDPLNFTLGEWLGAKGQVNLTPLAGGTEKVVVTFTGLKPGGVYSLFENHFDQQPVGFTPLDGKGTENSFVAGSDGRGMLTVLAPQQLTHANAVLLVYHSDAKTYGASRGTIGVTAHHQLIVRLP